jgi:hypothetical protein
MAAIQCQQRLRHLLSSFLPPTHPASHSQHLRPSQLAKGFSLQRQGSPWVPSPQSDLTDMAGCCQPCLVLWSVPGHVCSWSCRLVRSGG